MIGESCVDVYRMGTVSRLNPEAPVPVLDFSHEFSREGMVGNVKKNLINAGCHVTTNTGSFEKKIRYVDSKTNHQIMREDQFINEVYELNFKDIKLDCDAVVISDYDKGYVSYELVEELRMHYRGPIFVDTKKKDLRRFAGCFVKINEQELINSISDTEDLIVTFGGEMVTYLDKMYRPPKIEINDACGCGDTFLAWLVYGYLETSNMDLAIELAMKAAAITVQHIGVYAPKLEEVQ